MILVVGTHQAIDVMAIPWAALSAVVLVRCVSTTGTFDTKHRLRVQTNIHDIPLYIAFAITQPPIDCALNVPRELLIGFGKVYDEEVMIYGDPADNLCNRCDPETKV